MSAWAKLLAICRRKSPWVYRVGAGSCNGCDIEIGPCMTPRYDAEQMGMLLQGSPKHADILLITGNVYEGSPLVDGPVDKAIPVDVWVPGCPPRPQLILAGVAQAARLLADGRTVSQQKVAGPTEERPTC